MRAVFIFMRTNDESGDLGRATGISAAIVVNFVHFGPRHTASGIVRIKYSEFPLQNVTDGQWTIRPVGPDELVFGAEFILFKRWIARIWVPRSNANLYLSFAIFCARLLIPILRRHLYNQLNNSSTRTLMPLRMWLIASAHAIDEVGSSRGRAILFVKRGNGNFKQQNHIADTMRQPIRSADIIFFGCDAFSLRLV